MFDPCIAHQDPTPQVIDLRGFFLVIAGVNGAASEMDEISFL
jgi:hypothetical protein